MNDIINQNSVPGIGISGVVMCPYFRGTCLKGGCELWIELDYGKQKVGRCAHAWKPIIDIEFRETIKKELQNIKSADYGVEFK